MSDIDTETLAILRLTFCKGIGDNTISALVSEFGSAQNATSASKSELTSTPGISDALASTIKSGPDERRVEMEIDLLERTGSCLVSRDSESYPEPLRGLDASAPYLLRIRGDYRDENRLAIALVGSRRATHYGRSQARRFAMQLGGMGFTIVSGMARGIDTESHRAAVQGGAPTIAVLGCGLSRIDSLHDPELALEICENGALISELPMDAPPLPKHFPPRNRLISGLSIGVVVLEARKRSGSLITARHAGEQGKDVFALPGNVTSGSSSGCHKLIRDGATLVENPVEITEELGPLSSPVELPRRDNSLSHQTSDEDYTLEDPRVLSLNERERQVFEMLSHAPVQIDDLTGKTGLPSSIVSSTLLTLEIWGLIKRLPGQNYVRS